MDEHPDKAALLAAELIARFALAAFEGREPGEADFGDKAAVEHGQLIVDGQIINLRDAFGGGMRLVGDAIRLAAEARGEDPIDVARSLLREAELDVSLADVDLG